jgi:hypothetical protein
MTSHATYRPITHTSPLTVCVRTGALCGISCVSEIYDHIGRAALISHPERTTHYALWYQLGIRFVSTARVRGSQIIST